MGAEIQVPIHKMNSMQLLAYVIDNPEYLSDPYYLDTGNKLRKRFYRLAIESNRAKNDQL